jgi:prevent-host-death family protein
MVQVSVEEIQRNLSFYLKQVETGEIITIIKSGKPLAEIKPVQPITSFLRPYGLCAGEFSVPDDFDAPLPEQIIREFEMQ